MSDIGLRFRMVHQYADAQGFSGGFPNFHQADYGHGLVYGTLLLRPGFSTWRDVLAATLGNPPSGDVGARFRATQDYAGQNGFVGGFPNFEQANYGQGLVFGTSLLSANAAEWRDVPAAALGNPPGGDIEARFRATHDYAFHNGFAAGFPNFHQADYGHGLVYGTILLRPAAVEWRDVPASALTPPEPVVQYCVTIISFVSGNQIHRETVTGNGEIDAANKVRKLLSDWGATPSPSGAFNSAEIRRGPC